MNYTDIMRLRLRNQLIASHGVKTPLEVVSWMGAVQAQSCPQAIWAIGCRQDSNLQTVEQAISDGDIVRTWPMRGTIHFVPARDARWMTHLFATRLLKRDGQRLAHLGLDPATLQKAEQIITNALTNDRLVRRSELLQKLERADISTKAGRGYHILWRLAQQGITAIGPTIDKQQTFGLLDRLAPDSLSLPDEAALATLAHRYISSHGPATARDFAWWTGGTLTEARRAITSVAHEFVSQTIDGEQYWFSQSNLEPTAHEGAYLLPGFDEYLLGYKDRSHVLEEIHSQKVVPGGNGVFKPIIVIDGQVRGTWKSTAEKNSLAVEILPFTTFSAKERGVLDTAIDEYKAFYKK